MDNKLTNNHANVHNAKDKPLRKWVGSAILLLDLDAFFASVEQLDHPEWKGKPVIVGGSPEKRGVVSTASKQENMVFIPPWHLKPQKSSALTQYGQMATFIAIVKCQNK